MAHVLLINPNTSAATTGMLLDIARSVATPWASVTAVTAQIGVAMIVTAAELHAAGPEVVRLGGLREAGTTVVVVAAFGDPGVDALRQVARIPVVGIGAASVAEAASGGRRFGIATTTPGLVDEIGALVERSPAAAHFTGVRVPAGDPLALAADAVLQERGLAQAVEDCFRLDGAEAVVIGGGPLSAAARALRLRFGDAIVEPVPAAFRCVARLLGVAG